MSARFLVAKYARDLKRMEPRNFGVIVWQNGHVGAMFAGESEDEEIRPPKALHVRDKQTYRQWIAYWRSCLESDQIEVGRGHKADRESPEFVDLLRSTANGNYMLVDGGYVLDAVKQQDIPGLTEYLFRELVGADEETARKAHESDLLNLHADRVLRGTLRKREDFHTNWPVPCVNFGFHRDVKFDYALGLGAKPKLLLNKVNVAYAKSFESFMFNLTGLYSAPGHSFNRDSVISLVYLNGSSADLDAKPRIGMLDKLTTMVDVRDEAAAQKRLQTIATAE